MVTWRSEEYYARVDEIEDFIIELGDRYKRDVVGITDKGHIDVGRDMLYMKIWELTDYWNDEGKDKLLGIVDIGEVIEDAEPVVFFYPDEDICNQITEIFGLEYGEVKAA